MDKIFEVHPSTPIPGVLPNMKRITTPTRLELDKDAFMRCMNMGIVYAVVGEERVLVKEANYENAMELFDKHVEFRNKTIKLSSNTNIHDGVKIS